MSNFKDYTHIEETVQAVRLTAEGQADIIEALSREAERSLLADLQIFYNEGVGHYLVNFRYQTDKVLTKMQAGDYLVKLNAGNYVKMSAADFEAEYLNTSIDQKVAEADRLKPLDAFVKITYATHPETGITEASQLTPVGLKNLAKAMVEWYDAETNVYTLDFSDGSVTDPSGLAEIIEAFADTDKFDNNTNFVLKFDNGVKEGKPNQFNFIALQQFLGELKTLGPTLARRITGCTFAAATESAISAVTPSVNDRQWMEFATDLRMFTSIAAVAAITR